MNPISSANRNCGAAGDTPKFFDLGGVSIQENESPRRDYGPIGSEIRSDSAFKAYTKMMYSWVPDFCEKNGKMDANLRGSGLVPCLPKVTPCPQSGLGTNKEKCSSISPKWLSVQSPGNAFQQKGDGYGFTGCNSWQQSDETGETSLIHSPNLNEVPTVLRSPTLSSSGSSLTSETAVPLEDVMTTPLGRVRALHSSNYVDMQGFEKEYGYRGQLRPCFFYRPRKGKYFKKFTDDATNS